MKIVYAALVASCALAPAAHAQDYPTRAVHVIIPITAGTATDIVGRLVVQKLSEFWGRQGVVENRAGAGTSIGTAAVAKAAADGYTLLVNSSAHAVNPAIYAKLPYDTLKDFINVAPLAGAPNVLVVNPSSSIKSVADFIAAAKARPGQINFASAGIGTGTHLNLEKFKLMAGINLMHIPYKGTPEVVSDIIGDRVTSYFAPIAAAISLIQGGKLRAVAVSSARRSSLLPDVPTIAESGVPGFDFTLWFGLWAPTGTPADIVDKLARDTARALAQNDVREQLAKLGNDPMSMTPAQFSQFVRSEIDDSVRIVKAAGIEPQ